MSGMETFGAQRSPTFGGCVLGSRRRSVKWVSELKFYKTERGTIFRLKEDAEGRSVRRIARDEPLGPGPDRDGRPAGLPHDETADRATDPVASPVVDPPGSSSGNVATGWGRVPRPAIGSRGEVALALRLFDVPTGHEHRVAVGVEHRDPVLIDQLGALETVRRIVAPNHLGGTALVLGAPSLRLHLATLPLPWRIGHGRILRERTNRQTTPGPSGAARRRPGAPLS